MRARPAISISLSLFHDPPRSRSHPNKQPTSPPRVPITQPNPALRARRSLEIAPPCRSRGGSVGIWPDSRAECEGKRVPDGLTRRNVTTSLLNNYYRSSIPEFRNNRQYSRSVTVERYKRDNSGFSPLADVLRPRSRRRDDRRESRRGAST